MNENKLQLLLADDDEDDCLFFQEALNQLQLVTQLTTVQDGEQLMQLLGKTTAALPYVLFLDLNMPRKSGFECLSEIKQNEKLKGLPVVILSTSFEQTMADQLFENGAQSCLRKPTNFAQLKTLILQALTTLENKKDVQPTSASLLLPRDLN